MARRINKRLILQLDAGGIIPTVCCIIKIPKASDLIFNEPPDLLLDYRKQLQLSACPGESTVLFSSILSNPL